jgi:hypothetical protein
MTFDDSFGNFAIFAADRRASQLAGLRPRHGCTVSRRGSLCTLPDAEADDIKHDYFH